MRLINRSSYFKYDPVSITPPKIKVSSSKQYNDFIDATFTGSISDQDLLQVKEDLPGSTFKRNQPLFSSSNAYHILKYATEYYLLRTAGTTRINMKDTTAGKTSYVKAFSAAYDKLNSNPVELTGRNTKSPRDSLFFIDLIWSYWMEEAMLMHAAYDLVSRFKNIDKNSADQRQRMGADPLRPLSYIIWGYIQDEPHRLTVRRRAGEYAHEYGLGLRGKARATRGSGNSSPIFDVLNDLLTTAQNFMNPGKSSTDASPVLQKLRRLYQSLENTYVCTYESPAWIIRQEMLMAQYILSHPGTTRFLPQAAKTDKMNTITYHDLAVHGERIMLSVKYRNWMDVKLTSADAAEWANDLADSISLYLKSYHEVSKTVMAAS